MYTKSSLICFFSTKNRSWASFHVTMYSPPSFLLPCVVLLWVEQNILNQIPIDLKKSQIMTTEYYISGSQHHLACLPLFRAVAGVPLAHLCWSFSLWPDISSGALKSLPVCARHKATRPLKSH